jgi:hypothetical protein
MGAPFSTCDEMLLLVSCEGGNDQANMILRANNITPTTSSRQPPLHHEDERSCNRVAFSACVEINFVLHRNDVSEEEHKHAWYNKDEIRSIKNGVRESVATFTNAPNTPDDDDYCARGIENRTREGARRKLQNKVDARAAVFFEQEMQQEDGLFDPEEMADCYYKYSEHCHASAHMVALRDERAAMAIYGKPIKESSDYFVCLGRIANHPAVLPPASSAA